MRCFARETKCRHHHPFRVNKYNEVSAAHCGSSGTPVDSKLCFVVVIIYRYFAIGSKSLTVDILYRDTSPKDLKGIKATFESPDANMQAIDKIKRQPCHSDCDGVP